MGASSSTPQPSPQLHEQQQEESIAAATSSLPLLRSFFSRISAPPNPLPLQEALSLNPSLVLQPQPESLPLPPRFPELVAHIGSSIASVFFGGDHLDWVGFLRGYNRCCARMTASDSVKLLLRVYATACAQAGMESALRFEDDAGEDGGGKVSGELEAAELLMFFWMAWLMVRSARISDGEKAVVALPDVRSLVLSALVSADVVKDDDGIWQCDLLGVGNGVPVQTVQTWVLSTAVGLGDALARYVRGRVAVSASALEVEKSDTSAANSSSTDYRGSYLLTPGRAWAMSLSHRNSASDKLLVASFVGIDPTDLLYRSSVHGKGLRRFWSNIEGYKGQILVLISANSPGVNEHEESNRKWVIGVLSEQGFEDRDMFYGSSVFLYAVDPIFRMLVPSGKEKNFIYSHLRPAVRAYQANPKPVGLGFGGTVGNERIFIDEDFAKVTLRHHAVDKTYQNGSLVPNQGFLPVEVPILEVEAWGFAGEKAREQQDSYKKRENLFSEQRRKVDLKTFGNWEDSPEKMMMDMVADPNRPRREER